MYLTPFLGQLEITCLNDRRVVSLGIQRCDPPADNHVGQSFTLKELGCDSSEGGHVGRSDQASHQLPRTPFKRHRLAWLG